MNKDKKKQRVRLLVFSNGNIAAFGPDDQQIPELQRSVNQFICQLGEDAGFDPRNFEVEYYGGFKSQPFKTEDGWNHREIR